MKKELPADIEQIFYDMLLGDKSIPAFEEWLYANRQLESVLEAEDYLALISYGYKSRAAHYELSKLLKKHVDLGELEKRRIYKLLTKVLDRDKDLRDTLMAFYDECSNGYGFLDGLGLGYGLTVANPYELADRWEELSEKQQRAILDSFYPDIEKEVKKVMSWLDEGKIVLTGVSDAEYGFLEYIDNRTEEEKDPPAHKVAANDDKASKPWWKFW